MNIVRYERVVTVYVYIEGEHPNEYRRSGDEWEANFGVCWEYYEPPEELLEKMNLLYRNVR